MWKIFVGFIAFALLALFVIMKGGDKVDMQGEAGHGMPSASSHSEPAPAAPAASAPAASEPAPAASAPGASAPAGQAAPAASEPAASK
ncbi:MAG TPA: hypothetical protein VEC01_16190 [Noviherbaspirillum sp.]|uniref:hypothetical protein n=1 Tax=Noviherbaspirillum sp. TaxID=1926288 RepID=UPI002D6C08B0|nr:hypothetical protein [Noviherbaspirillum sp.]HYD96870.1 hypothetical protein [Noviherbaspirillum sp.]